MMTKKDIRILYVEDEQIIRNLYVPFIEEKTSNLYIAENGGKGLELFKKHKPDLVISDIRMPIMDGLEMTSKIKEIDLKCRIIIITAFSQQEYFTRAIKLGVNGFLVKPVTKDDLMAVIDEQIKIILTERKVISESLKRNQVQRKLKKLNEELEMRVDERTLALQNEIDERIQAEEMLRESEEKYRQIFENANDGIILTINGIVRFINPKIYEITGFLPKESISKPFTNFVHPDYKKFVYNNHIGRLNGEDVPERYDIQAYTKSGDLKWFEIKSTIIQWEDQPAVLTFLTDITERKKISSQLRELNLRLENRVQEELKKIKEQQQQLIQKSKLESLGELAAGIAHEINQPLGGISLLLDNIQYRSSKNELTTKYLDDKLRKSFEDIDRIKMIIDHIRTFSRDQEMTDFTRMDIQEVIMNALGMIKNQYQKHEIEFELHLYCKEAFITGNPYKLEQVLLNIFSNARFAVREKCKLLAKKNIDLQKKIIISTFSEDKEIGITIEDNGIGIPKKLQKNIFDPFFTTKSEEVGTGLGLSISYGIIKEMHGNISVESKENEFTRMIIKFPIYKKEQ